MVLNTAFQYQSIEVTYRILASIFSLDFSGPSKGMSMLCSVFFVTDFLRKLVLWNRGKLHNLPQSVFLRQARLGKISKKTVILLHQDLPSDLSLLYNMLQLQLAKEENWSQKRAFIIEKLRTTEGKLATCGANW